MKTRNPANPQTKRRLRISAAIVALLAAPAFGYLINNWWPDGDNIVMDDVLMPAATWSDPAQFQMSEWNEVDTTDNSHPFRINANPEFSFGANDGDNTIGFLGEAGLMSEYGLSYASALAWTVCWRPLFGLRYDECDVMLDPTLSWRLGPDDNFWFQSTVLHELGHVRGLGHYNNYLSIENSPAPKLLRNEILYMDDKEGVRQNATHVSERDLVVYHKWHDGSSPRWMSMSPTTLREGQTIQLNNVTVENRGSLSFSSAVRFGAYLSTNATITTGDQLLNTGTFSSFNRFTFSTFNWTAVIPPVNDCGVRYIGGIIDDNNQWSERFEANNATVFTDGNPYSGTSCGSTGGPGCAFTPTPLNILLAEDVFEQNDSLATASPISLPFFNNQLSIDADLERDYYRFQLGQAGTLQINALFSHSTGDIDLFLLNSAGQTLASSTSVTDNESIVYAAPPGTYYVFVEGFGGGSCNRYALDVSVSAPPMPDLTVDVLQPTTAPPYIQGQSVQWQSLVENIGDAASGATRVGFYLGTSCGDLTNRVDSAPVPALNPGSIDIASRHYTFAAQDVGTRYMTAFVDYEGLVGERLEGNNTLCYGPFSVACSAPAVPGSISYPSSDADGSFVVSWAAASGAISYTLQRANNPSFSGATTLFTGAATSYNESGLADGNYYYRVRANNTCGSSGWRNGGQIVVGGGGCFALTLGHTGQGANPTASPASSSACAAGSFQAGENIDLSASPGAASGWTIIGWSGTADDASRSEQNSLTMPAAPHSATVHYGQPPEAIDLISFAASESAGGVLLEWQTGYEIDNLGFHVYREDKEGLHRLTPSLVAGSALTVGTVLSTGYSYRWLDADPRPGSVYWLEDIDLDGGRNRYGPTSARASGDGHGRAPSFSPFLKALGRENASQARPAEREEWVPGEAESARTIRQRQAARRPAIKILVSAEGVHRLGASDLFGAGMDPSVNPRNLHLYSDGADLPLEVRGEQDGRLDPEDAVLFYGFGQDSPSSGQRTYWLLEGATPGLRFKDFAPTRRPVSTTSFPQTLRWRPRTTYAPSLLNGEDANFFGPVVAEEEVASVFEVEALDPAGGQAQLEVRLHGLQGQHRVRTEFNGAHVGDLVFRGTDSGSEIFELPAGLLAEGLNTVVLTGLAGGEDISLVDEVKLTYPRRFLATAGRLTMTLEEGETARIEGFDNAEVVVLDVTDPEEIVRMDPAVEPSGSGFAATVASLGPGTRRVSASTAAGWLQPDEIRPNRPSKWAAEREGADAVFLTHASLADSLRPLVEFRRAQGWRVSLVDVEDVYDEYSFGAKTPLAIRRFLRDARENWSPAPRFALLAGGASLDPRGRLGASRPDLVPTRMLETELSETASDNWLADFDEDGRPEMALGRLPADNAAELGSVVRKIVDYEREPFPGLWKSNALFAADEQGEFPYLAEARRFRRRIPESVTVTEIRRNEANAGDLLGASVGRGQALVVYLGHGSVQRWAGGLMDTERASRLRNGRRLPFVLSLTCLTGFFPGAQESLAEVWLKHPRGGAVAFLGSTSLAGVADQIKFSEEILENLYGDGQDLTLGEAVLRARRSPDAPSSVGHYVLFGDPLTRFQGAAGSGAASGWRRPK